jgi:predicted regulator of Ras-like GTPase activity (Roadblock/LC7/MglB family)
LNPPGTHASGGEGEALLRSAVRDAVHRGGARVGFLLDPAGMVSAAAGNPGSLEPTSFVSLAAAQFTAAQDLASTANRGDLTQLVQEGAASRTLLASIHGGRALVLLYDLSETRGTRGWITATEHSRRTTEVMDVDQTAKAMGTDSGGSEPGARSLGDHWSEDAEGEIDRVFGGEG